MKSANAFPSFRYLAIAAACAALAACGGGGGANGTDVGTTTAASTITVPSTAATAPSSGANASTGTTPASGSSAATAASVITDVRIQNTDPVTAQTNVPFTFGQVFAAGQVKSADALSARLEDGTVVALQMDVKATHPDGSVRHAVVSGILPNVAAGGQRTVSLVKGGNAPAAAMPASVGDLMRNGMSFSFHAKINGTDYYASADDLLKSTTPTSWLKGGVANEWQVATPLRTADGTQHPHLSARFAIRYYGAIKKARIDMTVENDWAYEPSPQNFKYDASVIMNGKSVYSNAGLNHLHHTRWRKIFWFSGTEPKVASEPSIAIKHNTAYLIASRAVPNYDQSLVIPEQALADMQTRWNGIGKEPMSTGLITYYMPMTGGRDDIGLLPAWGATYLLSQDSRAREITLRTADLAGSFSSHYRDKNTGRPVSLLDYPYMTIAGRSTDTGNPATGKYEAFPGCGGDCSTPNTHDVAHQPAMAYLPYLVTGDYYYLEELQFWAMYNAFSTNPGYRDNIKGIMSSEQVRGQAWSLRTLAEAAYITPDTDSLKKAFTDIINNNLDWYNKTYTDNASANKLGVIVNGYALGYDNNTGLAPWQDDFFTAAIGHAAELGFTKATSLLAWKAQFPIERMVGKGACWIDAASYSLRVRSADGAPFYSTIGEAYAASHDAATNALACGSAAMASAFGLKVGEMTGYANAYAGYPSNMQPALAYAADVGGGKGKAAWNQFAARSVKPDYRYGPQFAIVPR
ncbi:hypothetical protein [Massilia sp. TN1-12]|uniref:RIFT barrel domain-containing protein n=1 Tax=Massilia paldalensis TaxID=3377675 RepID=UPI00384CD2E6